MNDLPTIREKVAGLVLAQLAHNGWKRTDLPGVNLEGLVFAVFDEADLMEDQDEVLMMYADHVGIFMGTYDDAAVTAERIHKLATAKCEPGRARLLFLDDEPRIVDVEFGVGPS